LESRLVGMLVAGSWLTLRRRPHAPVQNHVGGVGSVDVRHPRPAAHPTCRCHDTSCEHEICFSLDCCVVDNTIWGGAQPVVGRQHQMPTQPILRLD
jgi:hypothetical protein